MVKLVKLVKLVKMVTQVKLVKLFTCKSVFLPVLDLPAKTISVCSSDMRKASTMLRYLSWSPLMASYMGKSGTFLHGMSGTFWNIYCLYFLVVLVVLSMAIAHALTWRSGTYCLYFFDLTIDKVFAKDRSKSLFDSFPWGRSMCSSSESSSITITFFEVFSFSCTSRFRLTPLPSRNLWSTIQYSTLQSSPVQYSTVQYSTVQYSTVSCQDQSQTKPGNHLCTPDRPPGPAVTPVSHQQPPVDSVAQKVQCSAVQYSTVQYSTVQYSTVQYSTVQYSTVQYSTVQYSAVQYSTVQYSAYLLFKPGLNTGLDPSVNSFPVKGSRGSPSPWGETVLASVQYSQCSAVQYSAVQYNTVQYSQCTAILYIVQSTLSSTV